MIKRHDFENMATACAALAVHVADVLRDALTARGEAALAVSGGKSPIPVFHALRAASLDWSKVTITLADDRQVDENSPLSNAALVRRELLQQAASAAHFVPLSLRAHIRLPLDMLVLGMGQDAHTASLFPGQPMEDGGNIIAVTPDPLPPEAPVARWSLSLPVLRDARNTALLINGEAKRAVLEDALRHPDVAAKPISAVLHAPQNPVTIYWSTT
jgi:6-phosphogluconolactonase